MVQSSRGACVGRLFVLVCLLVTMLPPATPVAATRPPDSGPTTPPATVTPPPPISARPPADFVPESSHTVTTAPAHPGSAPTPGATSTTPHFDPGHLSLSFVPNVGQSDQDVQFQSQGLGGTLFFTPDELVVSLPHFATDDHAQGMPPAHQLSRRDLRPHRRTRRPDLQVPRPLTPTVVRLQFEGANATPPVRGRDPLPGVVNYFIGNDPDQWRTNITTYAGIVYEELYPGIDLRYDGDGGQLKGTYLLDPGADPAQIRWRYAGATAVQVDPATGDLVIDLPDPPAASRAKPTAPQRHTLTEQAPIAWQELAGRRMPVDVRYALADDDQISFVVGDYDPAQPLIIDPTLAYSTYLGGSFNDWSDDIAIDAAGAAYVIGQTYSSDFPAASGGDPPYQSNPADIFIAKIAPAGDHLSYRTYLGGSGYDYAAALALDDAGNVYATGGTNSDDFPAASFRGGDHDAFVVSLNATGSTLRYSRYLGGSSSDDGRGIAVDQAGNAHIIGTTDSDDFPAASFRGGDHDAFVVSLNATGSTLRYSRYLGGSNYDSGASIALDRMGNTYITGHTYSADFPGASDYGGGSDAFVSSLTNDGTTLRYSLYLGSDGDEYGIDIAVGANDKVSVVGDIAGFFSSSSAAAKLARILIEGQDDTGNDVFLTTLQGATGTHVATSYLRGTEDDYAGGVAVDTRGMIIVSGTTYSTDFPLAQPLDATLGGWADAFVATFSPTAGQPLRLSTYLGGSDSDHASSVAVDSANNPYVFGWTYSDDFPTAHALQNTRSGGTDTFITKLGRAVLPVDQNNPPERCPCDAQPQTSHPVNTRTGVFWTSTTDLAVRSPGPALAWTRTYVSRTITETLSGLGPGWQHPYATRLITETMAGGEPGVAIIISPQGNRFRFRALENGTFTTFPGIFDTLVQSSDVYTQTLRDQTQYIFDATTGRLRAMIDPQGRELTLSYDGSGRLATIVDARDTSRQLTLGYSGSDPQIASVTDGSRTVRYTYDANGDLTTFEDVMGRPTTYTYQDHLLTQMTDALGQAVEQMTYTQPYTPASQVISQTLQDGRHLQFSYGDSSTVITTTGVDGRQDVAEIFYTPNNTTTGTVRNGIVVGGVGYDEFLAPDIRTDANGNTTHTVFDAAGQPLSITNALSETTQVTYDDRNRPTVITDTLNRRTELAYDNANNLIRQTTSITNSFPGFTTVYTYTGDQWLAAQQGPDGVVTRYERTPLGQVTELTVGDGTPDALTTRYGYDQLGRVVTTTVGVGTPLERVDVTAYNADDTVARTIQNYVDGTFDPAVPDEDLITTYGYDNLGRQVWMRDALGTSDVTHYDAQGRVEWTARNLTPFDVDADGLPVFQPFDPATPDQNVATRYGYDGLGRTTLVTQTGILTGTFDPATRTFSQATERVTRTEYDDLSRPVTVTLNYRPGEPAGADVNVQTLTQYDAAGNVIRQRDALGRWTVTDYDALNRPITVTLNYENGDPLTVDAANESWATITDTDIVQVTTYTADGQIDRTIANYLDGVFDPADPVHDRITASTYDDLGRVDQTIQTFVDGVSDPTEPDTDLIRATRYDGAGRVQATQDALGRWTTTVYDGVSRVSQTIQHCTDANGVPQPTGCVSGHGPANDRNIATELGYDALWRTVATTDVLARTTQTIYDGVGRTVTTIQNADDGSYDPANPDTDVTTQQTYDALGRVTVTTDPEGATTTTAYDALGRAIATTDAETRTSRMGYDGTGAMRWMETPDGRFTVMQVDGLGRVTTSIQNYADGAVSGSEPVDQDLITQTRYDVAGRRVATVDPDGRTTRFAYDLRDQLIGVTENAADGACPTAPCNVVTQYQYDRASNQRAVVDARGITTRQLTYDAQDRQISRTDALGQTTSYQYDRQGRMTGTDDPRGPDNDLTYAYDDQDRPTGMSATNLAAPISMEYNPLGWRTSLGDATGTTSFSHDALGRITGVTAPDTGSVGYGYNARGQRTQLTYPDSTVVDYTYFADGQLQEVLQGSTTLASYTYDSAGRRDTLTRANGAVTTYSYDDADRLRDLHTTVGGTTASRFQYDVDRLGLRTGVTETLAGGTPQPTCGPLTQEAEDGVLTGAMTVGSAAAASGGQYVAVPEGTGNHAGGAATATATARYCFTVTEAGVYRIIGQVRAPTETDNSFFVQVNGAPQDGYLWGLPVTTGAGFVAIAVRDESAPTPVELTLPVGTHEVVIALREDGTQLDAVTLAPVPTCGSLTQEAEDGVLTGAMTVGTASAASGGQYVAVPEGTGNNLGGVATATARYCFTVTQAGVYRIIGQVRAPTESDNSFFVQVNGAPQDGYLWDIPVTTGAGFVAIAVRAQGTPTPVELTLPVGTHEVVIALREDGTQLDQVTLERQGDIPAPVCGPLTQEAEDGVLTGAMTVGAAAAASGGQYVAVPEGTGNNLGGVATATATARYCFTVTQAGVYRIIGQIRAPTGMDDSFFVQVNGVPQDGYLWDLPVTTDASFVAVAVQDRGTATPVELALSVGTHEVVIALREDGAQLDQVTLTRVSAALLTAPAVRADPAAAPAVHLPLIAQAAADTHAVRSTVLTATQTNTRTISYTYDGLLRLTDATEDPGTMYTYTYDLAGNRTAAGEDGAPIQQLSYNAANQVVGWSYDAAGNLLDDGTTTYTYDALQRLTQQNNTSHSYNGDGVLVQRTRGAGTWTYAQDLVAPLSQMLTVTYNGDPTNYLYGHERLQAQNPGRSTRSWYHTDALGSVRQLSRDSGAIVRTTSYDPWGTIQGPDSPGIFGFTGEFQDEGLVHLRARWYAPGHGTFTSRDPFAGFAEMPYSLHPYQYAYSAPTTWTDPTGEFICDPVRGWSMELLPPVNIEYVEYCHRQRARLLEDPVYISYQYHDMLGSLIYLFTDPRLPGGAQQPVPAPFFRGTPAQERLDFILWVTQSPLTGTVAKRLADEYDIGPHFNADFVKARGDNPQLRSDTGFGEQFRDGHLWVESSRQVGHFLTAVRMGRANAGGDCVVGHEFSGDGSRSKWRECWSGQIARFAFFDAVAADLAGDAAQRDCIIADILADLPEEFDPAHYADRAGNSRQDLRLSVKGWGFGRLVEQRKITTLEQAQAWLTTNLR